MKKPKVKVFYLDKRCALDLLREARNMFYGAFISLNTVTFMDRRQRYYVTVDGCYAGRCRDGDIVYPARSSEYILE